MTPCSGEGIIKQMIKMWCSECNEWINVVDGVTAFYDHSAWWCAHHASILEWVDGVPIVNSPSPGMLIPSMVIEWYRKNLGNDDEL